MPAADVNKSFRITAPELIDPRQWGVTDAKATMASDVYAFAILVLEVRVKFVVSLINN